MKKILVTIILSLFISSSSFSLPGDTIVVQTFTFNDITKRRGLFQFPDDSKSWAKIIMVRTLKCDSQTTQDKYPCGEWDYTTNTLIYVSHPGDTAKEIFELENFVTPYGKRLDLNGDAGWSFIYDVTDYAPLLKGEVDISSGNQQELLDMKFYFIEGIPPRNVIAIENIYPWGMYNYGDISENKKLTYKNIVIRKDAKGYKLKARITGHREVGEYACCEWNSKSHKYTWGNSEFREVLSYWTVWKECGRNPIFPQGGTWPFNRGGWCPGSSAQTFEFDISNKFNPGDTITNFDYEIEPYSNPVEKGGEFVESHQIIFYGGPNFKNDVTIEDIIAPNAYEGYKRDNPICGSPRIIIKNTGSNLLQSLKITYGLLNGEKSFYEWHVQLKFLETQEVYLPIPDWKGMDENPVFIVTVSEPNNMPDEYELNNTLYSKISIPETLPNPFILHIESNNLGRAKENLYTIFDGMGKIFYSRPEFADSTVYDDKITLEEGCYTFLLTDKQLDGMMMHWWERDHPERIGISGKIRIISLEGDTLKKFSPDFGTELRYCFRIGK
jgi:hypothetical protein